MGDAPEVFSRSFDAVKARTGTSPRRSRHDPPIRTPEPTVRKGGNREPWLAHMTLGHRRALLVGE